MSDSTRKWLKLLIQIFVSAGLIAVVLRQLDLSHVKSLALRPQELPWLLAAIVLFNLSRIAGALRLNRYQRHAAILMSERDNLKLYYAGMFLNLFLPGGIGGDGYKILALRHRHAAPVKTLLGILLVDRFSGLLVLLLLLCMLAPLLALPWPQAAVQTLAAVSAMTLAAVFVVAHRRLVKMRGDRLATVFGYGLAVQLLQLACMGMLLASLRVPIDVYLAYLAVFLISSVAAVLPLSFGGLGAREVTFLYGLQLLQIDPMQGVVASAGFFLITVLSSLPGVLFLKGFPTRPPACGTAQS